MGNPLGESHHNVAHSYKRFGLRIFKLSSRENPCQSISVDQVNSSNSQNPSINSVFNDYVTYRIGEAGLLAEETGDMLFENFLIADSGHAGMEFYRTVLTMNLVKAENMTIVGRTTTNPSTESSKLDNARGVIGPRQTKKEWKISNVKFHNFNGNMVIMETCSKCDNTLLFTNTGQEYMVEDISYTNVTSKRLHMLGLRREIIFDLDGSFSNNEFDGVSRSSATVLNNFKHIEDEPDCTNPNDQSIWEDTLVCDSSLPLRKVIFDNMINKN